MDILQANRRNKMIVVENRMNQQKFYFADGEETKALEFAQKLAHGGKGSYAKTYIPVDVCNDEQIIWSWTSLDATGYEM